jgi:hypothetical protein
LLYGPFFARSEPKVIGTALFAEAVSAKLAPAVPFSIGCGGLVAVRTVLFPLPATGEAHRDGGHFAQPPGARFN